MPPLVPNESQDHIRANTHLNINGQRAMLRSKIDLYPNPSEGDFTVRFTGIDISKRTTLAIYSVLGSKIWEQKLVSNDPILVLLKKDLIPNGMYFLILKNVDQQIDLKFIIQR